MHVHPNYKYKTFLNDIAVLELEEEVDLSQVDGPRPACLPSQPLSAHLDKTATVSGFGHRQVWEFALLLFTLLLKIAHFKE